MRGNIAALTPSFVAIQEDFVAVAGGVKTLTKIFYTSILRFRVWAQTCGKVGRKNAKAFDSRAFLVYTGICMVIRKYIFLQKTVPERKTEVCTMNC